MNSMRWKLSHKSNICNFLLSLYIFCFVLCISWLFSIYFLFLLQDYIAAIEKLPDYDQPSYFGLPENIEQSSQKMISNHVISQLRALMRSDIKASKFDKDVWANELGPILNLWKKLNQVRMVIKSFYFPLF